MCKLTLRQHSGKENIEGMFQISKYKKMYISLDLLQIYCDLKYFSAGASVSLFNDAANFKRFPLQVEEPQLTAVCF